ncbi:MAG: YiiX/YebB-like N1pC/P60 family cysteine hydrolase [Candidatus Pacearchaeota archaeon]
MLRTKKIIKNRSNKIKFFLIILTVIFLINGILVAISISITKKKYSEKYPYIEFSDLKKGDILFGKSNFGSGPMPGYWSHTAIFYGYNNSTPLIIEAYANSPIRYNTLYNFVNERRHFMVGRVKNLTDEQRERIVNYAASKVGMPFDYWYLNKEKTSENHHYYCSELIWEAYLINSGIDLDTNPNFTLKYANAVAPQEIFDNPILEIYNLRVD